MKVDLTVQSILIGGMVISVVFLFNAVLLKYGIALVLIWQILSACHFYFLYDYSSKLGYLIIVGAAIPGLLIWTRIIGTLAYVPMFGLVLWYFWQTLRDTIVVLNRPRYFWDLF